MNSEFIYFDIETIPTQSDTVAAKLVENAKPPANYKSEDAIAKWREGKAAESVAKTSFDGGRGHVCCISWAIDDLEIQHAMAMNLNDEASVVGSFFASLGQFHSKTLVGHYINGFDIRFLTQRAIVLGVQLPPAHIWPRDPKPWDKGLADTMVMWAGAKGSISMDNLCDILGFPGKGDFDGSMVAEAWANGEHEKIAQYCRADVARTRDIHRRFMDVGW